MIVANMTAVAGRASPLVIDRIDHLVLTVADIDKTMDFYIRVLGLEPVTFGARPTRAELWLSQTQPAPSWPRVRTQGRPANTRIDRTYA